MGEVVKMVISAGLVMNQQGTLLNMFVDTRQLLRSSVPALLYLVQNNLQYIAVSNMQPATYSVVYQLKILSTALLSVLILGRSLKPDKWVALALLTLGVVVITASEVSKGGVSKDDNLNLPLGLTCTLIAILTSGSAGVYFELMLKEKAGGKHAPLSIWERNLQL